MNWSLVVDILCAIARRHQNPPDRELARHILYLLIERHPVLAEFRSVVQLMVDDLTAQGHEESERTLALTAKSEQTWRGWRNPGPDLNPN